MNGAAALVGVDERCEFGGAARAAGFVVVVIDDGVDGADGVGTRRSRVGSMSMRGPAVSGRVTSSSASARPCRSAYGDAALEPVHPGGSPFGVTNPIFLRT